jgi:DNA (cytosine-5)-methyltransferase 1
MMEMNNKAIDLFAGCGGLSLGLQNAGFSVTAAVDNWEPAIAVYKENFNHNIYSLNLSDVDATCKLLKRHDVDLIVGGPPCQDFSQAGKRNENLGRGNLTISFAEIVSQLRPKFFIMENVDQLTKTKKFLAAYEILKRAGYGITIRLICASSCGVPQRRKRYFVVGELGGMDDFLGEYLDRGLSPNPVTVREYFGIQLDTDYYYRHPWSYQRRAIYSIDEPSPTIRGVNRPIPAGYPGHHLDATHDLSLVRPLTTTERAMIQTFPSDFKWVGNKTQIEQMIGNAVPVKLAEYVANCLSMYISNMRDGINPIFLARQSQQLLLPV